MLGAVQDILCNGSVIDQLVLVGGRGGVGGWGVWGQRAGLGALVQEDVKRMLIKAHYGRHYVIIDHGDHVLCTA